MGDDDAASIERWQRGDRSAFEDLVRRWQGPVSRFLFGLVGRPELVQDLTQEVFLRVYRAGPKYRERGAFSTWLFQIAVNVARDAGRRDRQILLPLNGQLAAGKFEPAEVVCERRELTAALAQLIAELPEPMLVALVLRHYEEMPFEAIARLTGTPASTWKSRFTAALARLRSQLQARGWGPGDVES